MISFETEVMLWLQVITLPCGRPRPEQLIMDAAFRQRQRRVRPLHRIIDGDLGGIDGAFRHTRVSGSTPSRSRIAGTPSRYEVVVAAGR